MMIPGLRLSKRLLVELTMDNGQLTMKVFFKLPFEKQDETQRVQRPQESAPGRPEPS